MSKKVLWFLVTFVLLAGCVSSSRQVPRPGAQGGQVSLSPLLSTNAPAYTNDDCQGSYPASLADDDTYDTNWSSCEQPSVSKPIWLAYDLSHVPSGRRRSVLVVWYNETFNYDHTVVNDNAYD